MMAALASWQVDDPSFSYATSKPVANWLGFPGAVMADISFQVLGLGIIAFLVPLAVWGWSFVRRRVPAHMGLRLIAWIAATVLSTGVLAFLPAPDQLAAAHRARRPRSAPASPISPRWSPAPIRSR